jgi:hypothetical protein
VVTLLRTTGPSRSFEWEDGRAYCDSVRSMGWVSETQRGEGYKTRRIVPASTSLT